MSKVLTATYDAERHALELPEPLEGVHDAEKVAILIVGAGVSTTTDRPWLVLENSIPPEQGEDLARALQILENE